MRTIFLLMSLFSLMSCGGGGYPLSADADSRYSLIADDAFAGSSVNVLAGVKQTLFTHGQFQYAAYYNANRHLVLAKRPTDAKTWQTQVTPFTGNVDDAHNHISLVVDSEGFIHIAWDHHNSPLNYARSVSPGALTLERKPMLGEPQSPDEAGENSVTYPQFYALPSGDLLFAYRDGGSGRGNLVLNRYDLRTQQWQRLHSSVLDGEGKRSAYWDMSVDINGVVHLAWIWRETPDVASNHDLAYARSFDQGDTWQQYSPLNYARSVSPGALTLERKPMLGEPQSPDEAGENSVTYPQFYALPSGDLLFAYRDGGSGRGNLVLNRYDLRTQQWQRLHSSVLDGEGKRSAYWDMSVDINGVVHLAWIWRETPDVASNHDLAYARSFDQGDTWQQYDGTPYALPITESKSDVVIPIPQHHKLMNPPVVMGDNSSRPFIASYWADSPTDIPRYQVVYPLPQPNTWQIIKAPKAAENFELSGHGTKRPPISRTILLPRQHNGVTSLHLIYRDDFQRGQVMGLTMHNIIDANWESHVLHPQNVGAWEPSIDPTQWIQHGRADLLLQRVEQRDGNDAESAQVAPSHIGVLSWQASLQ